MAEYNPHGWNEYPCIKPLEGVVMCLEVTKHTFSSLLYPSREGKRFVAVWKPILIVYTNDEGQFTKHVVENRWIDENGVLIEAFTPNEKEAAAMYVLPKLVKTEAAQNLPKDIANLVHDWAEELSARTKK